VSVYSHVPVRSYVWPAPVKLAVFGGTSEGAEIEAPAGSCEES